MEKKRVSYYFRHKTEQSIIAYLEYNEDERGFPIADKEMRLIEFRIIQLSPLLVCTGELSDNFFNIIKPFIDAKDLSYTDSITKGGTWYDITNSCKNNESFFIRVEDIKMNLDKLESIKNSIIETIIKD